VAVIIWGQGADYFNKICQQALKQSAFITTQGQPVAESLEGPQGIPGPAGQGGGGGWVFSVGAQACTGSGELSRPPSLKERLKCRQMH
jgi:hypothetical protein